MLMEFREQNNPDYSGINSLMKLLQLLNIIKSQFIIPYTSRVFYGRVSYLTVFTDYVLNTTNNET